MQLRIATVAVVATTPIWLLSRSSRLVALSALLTMGSFIGALVLGLGWPSMAVTSHCMLGSTRPKPPQETYLPYQDDLEMQGGL